MQGLPLQITSPYRKGIFETKGKHNPCFVMTFGRSGDVSSRNEERVTSLSLFFSPASQWFSQIRELQVCRLTTQVVLHKIVAAHTATNLLFLDFSTLINNF